MTGGPDKDTSNFGFDIIGEIPGSFECTSPLIVNFYQKPDDIYSHHTILLEKNRNFLFKSDIDYSHIEVICDKNLDLLENNSEPAIVLAKSKIHAPDRAANVIKFHRIVSREIETIDSTKAAYHDNANIGKISPLNEISFAKKDSNLGLWKPLKFFQENLPGIYFSEEYDPQKQVLLLVHGINSSPTVFANIASKLKSRKLQIWVYYYPTGFPLDSSSRELFQLISIAQKRYNFKKFHIVAHSMGGLVARDYINRCKYFNGCKELASFTSISTPWGGHDAAEIGINYAPSVLPVWQDMVPGSDFLNQLFIEKLPKHVRHHLIFGIKQRDMLTFKTNDGVVSLESMLIDKAQNQAYKLIALNQDHKSILSDEALVEHLYAILSNANMPD